MVEAVNGARYVEGMREFAPDICWRYLPLEGDGAGKMIAGPGLEYACILPRGHDDGEHEPSEENENDQLRPSSSDA